MFALILTLLIVLVVLCIQFGTTYHTQVKVVRKFFRNKGSTSEETFEKTVLQKDLSYGSVFPCDGFDLYRASDATEAHALLVWVHGGGYVGGDKSDAEPWARAGCALVSRSSSPASTTAFLPSNIIRARCCNWTKRCRTFVATPPNTAYAPIASFWRETARAHRSYLNTPPPSPTSGFASK